VATWCAATTCRIASWYDQTGNGNTLTQSGNALRPTYLTGSLNSRSGAVFTNAGNINLAGASITQATPLTFTIVYEPTLALTSAAGQQVFSWIAAGSNLRAKQNDIIDNEAFVFNSGSSRNFTFNDGVPHAVTVVANGASSVWNADNAETTFTTSTEMGTSGVEMGFGSSDGFDGVIGEAGENTTALASGVRASLGANEMAWYGITPYAAGTGSYSGPVTAVSGATAFHGLRAYSQAYANGVSHGAVIQRASDSALKGIPFLTSGALDITTAVAFAGTDATCTGSIATTTLTVASCSAGTLHVGDQIADANITNPTIITAIGTCASPPGTCTVNKSQTAASAVFTATVAMSIVGLPDSSGNGVNAGNTTNFPELLANCVNTTLPCEYYNGSNNLLYTQNSIAQPYTTTTIGERTANFSTTSNFVNTSNMETAFFTSPNTTLNYAGSNLTATASDSALHALQFGLSGASSFTQVDGTNTTGNVGVNSSGSNGHFGDALTGFAGEDGTWPILFNSTQYGAMHTNMSAYWGTP